MTESARLFNFFSSSSLSEFTPRFEFPEYTVPENDGPVTVCIVVPAGQLERQVIVNFRTVDVDARGKTSTFCTF